MSISIFYLIHYLSLSLNLSQQVYLKHFSVSLSLSKRISGRYFFLSLSLSHYAWSLSMSLSKLSETFLSLSLSKRISGRYFFLSFFLIMYGLSKTKLWPLKRYVPLLCSSCFSTSSYPMFCDFLFLYVCSSVRLAAVEHQQKLFFSWFHFCKTFGNWKSSLKN